MVTRWLRAVALAAVVGQATAQVSATLGTITTDNDARTVTVNFAQAASPAYGGFTVSVERTLPLPITPIVTSVSLGVGVSSYQYSLGNAPPSHHASLRVLATVPHCRMVSPAIPAAFRLFALRV